MNCIEHDEEIFEEYGKELHELNNKFIKEITNCKRKLGENIVDFPFSGISKKKIDQRKGF